jgi:tRNA C32,U32 (ribose-2'-O)-methylase TrmJ
VKNASHAKENSGLLNASLKLHTITQRLPILPLLQAVNLLAKGVAIISYNLVLQACQIAGMRKAIAA